MKIKLIILTIVLFIVVACTRTYPNGDTEEVGWFDATMDKLGGTPIRKIKDKEPLKILTGDPIKDKEIAKANALTVEKNQKIEIHNTGARHDQQNPSNGLIYVLGTLLTAAGVGWAKTLLNKKNMETARDVANRGTLIATSRYQAIKDGVRNDPPLLEKVKLLAAEGTKFANESMELLEPHKDDIVMLKKIITTSMEK